jgi:hypothetical protein
MDQNRRPRHKPTHLQCNWSLTKEPKTPDGENTASWTNTAGKTGYPHVEDWNWIPIFTLYQNQLRVNQRL